MSQKIRVGIIGCGVIAPAHIESYQRLENIEVAWACDLIEEKARRLADKYGIADVTTDYRRMLDDADLQAVSICTDHASHAAIAVDCLDAGKHVLCEKALSSTTAGLDAMMQAHSRAPHLVFAGVFQHRFDRAIQCLRDLVQQGALGQILTAGVQVRCLRTNEYYRADKWRGTWELEGGAVLINQAIHFIDSILWIMDGAAAVGGAFANLTHGEVMNTEDTAVAAVRYRSGALGTIEATCSSHITWEPTLSVHGSAGSIELRHGKGLKVEFKDADRQADANRQLLACQESKVIDAGKSYYGASHPSQIADFVDSVRSGRKPFITAQSARHTVDVVLGIYQSHRQGAWVEIPQQP